jgi:hypothetical protein
MGRFGDTEYVEAQALFRSGTDSNSGKNFCKLGKIIPGDKF